MKKFSIFFILLINFIFNYSGVIVNNDSSYIILESTTLRVLEESNSDKQMLIASTAKILTAITVIENYNLDEEITISKNDVNEVGSKVYFKEGDRVSRRDLLYALMLRSANDAASALSNNNDDLFINQMNNMAKKIGMKNSTFENASGLDENKYNLSTAYDMAILSVYASKNKTFVDIASTHTHKCTTNENKYTWTNKHRLVKNDEYFVWGKTGYTKKAKRILVSNYIKNDMNVVIVTINKNDDWNYHNNLINSLDNYDFLTIFKSGIYDTKMDVTYYLSIEEDVILPLKEDEYENVKLSFKLFKNKAILNIYLYEKIICSYNIAVYDKKNINIDDLVLLE